MSMTGMIFQFNSDDGRGLLMLSDGETKEFSISQWADNDNVPSVGIKISYEESNNKICITAQSEAVQKSSLYATVDEGIAHFKEEGFKVVNDTTGEMTRTVTMRKYENGDFFEVIIKSINGKTSVVHMVNGKKTN